MVWLFYWARPLINALLIATKTRLVLLTQSNVTPFILLMSSHLSIYMHEQDGISLSPHLFFNQGWPQFINQKCSYIWHAHVQQGNKLQTCDLMLHTRTFVLVICGSSIMLY